MRSSFRLLHFVAEEVLRRAETLGVCQGICGAPRWFANCSGVLATLGICGV